MDYHVQIFLLFWPLLITSICRFYVLMVRNFCLTHSIKFMDNLLQMLVHSVIYLANELKVKIYEL